MAKKLFVGSLSYSTSDQSLFEAFSQYGTVSSATVIMDRDTGRSRGFGFVEYNSAEEALQAVEALNGSELDGRVINVNEARERPPRGDGPRGNRRDRGDRDRW